MDIVKGSQKMRISLNGPVKSAKFDDFKKHTFRQGAAEKKVNFDKASQNKMQISSKDLGKCEFLQRNAQISPKGSLENTNYFQRDMIETRISSKDSRKRVSFSLENNTHTNNFCLYVYRYNFVGIF